MKEKPPLSTSKRLQLAVFVLVAAVLVAGGYAFYLHECQRVREVRYMELKTLAEMKAGQIVVWRDERMGDARMNSADPFFSTALVRWITAPEDLSTKADIFARLQLVRELEGFEDVILAGTDGHLLLSLNPSRADLDDHARNLVRRVVSSGDITFDDFFRCPGCSQVRLDVAAPVFGGDHRPIAVLILRVDPEHYLYPLIQSWPSPSRTSETLLVRKEGDDVLFLSRPRHQISPALTLRIPLTRAELPAARAVLGHTGEYMGLDYRGVDVLADVRPVPGSPWFIVSKVDTEEILAETRYRGKVILLFVVLAILAAGAMAGFAFNYRQRNLYQDLYRNETLYRSLVEHLPQRIFLKDRNSVYQSCNGNFARNLGLAPGEITGKDDSAFFPPEFAERYREDDRGVMDTGEMKDIEEVHRLDGEVRCFHTVKVPHRDEQGRIAGVLGIVEDITERKRAEEEIRLLNTELEERVKDRTAQLEAANQELEAFAYSVSHDLRTPLRTMTGFSDALLSGHSDRLDEKGRDYLQRIHAAACRMGQLIDDMLKLSRVTRGEMIRRPVDLSALAREVAAELQAHSSQRSVVLEIAGAMEAEGDARLLRLALENLMANAWKFTGTRPEARIEVGLAERSGERVYFVRDNGVGFDMVYAPMLFAPFQRLHKEKEFPGTGIGLATVKRIIRRHGGRVWAEAAVDLGATFYFTLGAHHEEGDRSQNVC